VAGAPFGPGELNIVELVPDILGGTQTTQNADMRKQRDVDGQKLARSI